MAEIVKIKKKVLKITIISLAAFIFIFSAGSMIFFKSVYDSHFQRTEKLEYSGYLGYKDLHGYDRTMVEFESGKNTLKGYIYGEKNTKGLVVIAHGLGFGADDYMAETVYFADHGWRVFSFDCTGTHESEGKNTVGLPQSMLDLKAALNYIKDNDGLRGLPIMLYGHSWGAYAVTAILNYDFDISAVTSIAGFNSPMELANEQVKSMLGAFSYIEYPFEWMYQTMLFGSITGITAVDGINKTDIPVMIIHGKKDESISYNGASIISHKDKITNPNVIYKTCSAENRDGHKTLFRSAAAMEYAKILNEEYKKLFDSYNGKVPDKARVKFYTGVDKFRTSELDKDFMNEINSFFEKNLKN
jgi:pimeloyl-ACP methyl ester carboxylesterase